MILRAENIIKKYGKRTVVKGVSFDNEFKLWKAEFMFKSKKYRVGKFETIKEASEMLNKAKRRAKCN